MGALRRDDGIGAASLRRGSPAWLFGEGRPGRALVPPRRPERCFEHRSLSPLEESLDLFRAGFDSARAEAEDLVTGFRVLQPEPPVIAFADDPAPALDEPIAGHAGQF